VHMPQTLAFREASTLLAVFCADGVERSHVSSWSSTEKR
jgi:hypothetical protein